MVSNRLERAGCITRLTHLFADYSPDEIAVLHDWFTRASMLAADYLEEYCRPD
ncbi:hypothetical protein ACFYOA_20685 [Streptomyces iakyrus]|uniref:hypothetical protein n=1 Tax=Streptomyces iakyrus TaxID=68219 RepID=UPI0036C9B236